MKINLYAQRTVREVKKDFHKAFPFLKIEFIKGNGETSQMAEQLPGDAELIEVSGVLREGTIEISPKDSVLDLEQRFHYGFGLPVQVYRKQKDDWTAIKDTNYVSLDQQNEMGIMTSALISEPIPKCLGWD